MLYISKIGDYSKFLTDDKVKDFKAINFSEYSKSWRGKLYSELSEEQHLRKIVKLLYIFLIITNEVEMQSNSFSLSWCNQILLIIV